MTQAPPTTPQAMPDEIYAWNGFAEGGSWNDKPCPCTSHESVRYIRADLAPTAQPKAEALEKIAELLWRRDYPTGGSVYQTYDSTPFHDKEIYRKEALEYLVIQAPAEVRGVHTHHYAISIDYKQAAHLLDLFGGEPTIYCVQYRKDGHSGKGLYAHVKEYPEDGSYYLGEPDNEAMPPKEGE